MQTIRTTIRVLAALVAISALHACSDDAQPVAASTAAIVGGAPLDNPAIVRLVGQGLCTGALVAPNIVLTAKHCVVTFKGGGPFECDEHGELVVDPDAPVQYVGAGEFDQVVSADSIFLGTESPYAPRGLNIVVSEGDTICRSDAALIVFDRPVDDPMLVPLRLDAPVEEHEPLVAVGFGQHEGGDTSVDLLARDVTVVDVGPKAKVPGVADAVRPGFFTTTQGVCRGDSGSPALSSTGAAVGIASSVSRYDLGELTGTAEDCVGELTRAAYQTVGTQTEVIEATFAEAGALVWREGEPDPRAGLADFEEPCERDADCRSNACVVHEDGVARCSHGCLLSACPEGYGCELVDDRKRCVQAEVEPPAPPTTSDDGGCSLGGVPAPRDRMVFIVMLGALLVARRK